MSAGPKLQPKGLMVCLDLEGTLISNAVSQIPRPHLFEFLECISLFADIVLYTSVSEERTAAIKKLLVAEEVAPRWFKDLISVHPQGTIKYRSLVPRIENYEHVLLVDDQSAVVNEDETDWLIQIKEFLPPYSDDDQELLHTLTNIKRRFHIPQTFKAEFRPTASRLKSIGEKGRKGMENLDSKEVGKWRE